MPVHNILHVSRIYSKYVLHSQEVDFLEIHSVTLSWSLQTIYVGWHFIHCYRENYSLYLKQWLNICVCLCLLCICRKSIYRINNNNNNRYSRIESTNYNKSWCRIIESLYCHKYRCSIEFLYCSWTRCSIVIPPATPPASADPTRGVAHAEMNFTWNGPSKGIEHCIWHFENRPIYLMAHMS